MMRSRSVGSSQMPRDNAERPCKSSESAPRTAGRVSSSVRRRPGGAVTWGPKHALTGWWPCSASGVDLAALSRLTHEVAEISAFCLATERTRQGHGVSNAARARHGACIPSSCLGGLVRRLATIGQVHGVQAERRRRLGERVRPLVPRGRAVRAGS